MMLKSVDQAVNDIIAYVGSAAKEKEVGIGTLVLRVAVAEFERGRSSANADLGLLKAQIKHMVNRFLSWKLPENFNPDGGISFKAEYNDSPAAMALLGIDKPMRYEPVGTNLLDAVQAEAMVRYMLDGMPAPAGRTERLKAAIEGECDGLAIDDAQAEAILSYVLDNGAAE